MTEIDELFGPTGNDERRPARSPGVQALLAKRREAVREHVRWLRERFLELGPEDFRPAAELATTAVELSPGDPYRVRYDAVLLWSFAGEHDRALGECHHRFAPLGQAAADDLVRGLVRLGKVSSSLADRSVRVPFMSCAIAVPAFFDRVMFGTPLPEELDRTADLERWLAAVTLYRPASLEALRTIYGELPAQSGAEWVLKQARRCAGELARCAAGAGSP